MTDTSIYEDIARRTGGSIYVGVVGPVRTGKSTLIKKFMEKLVLPNMKEDYEREKARDELPQSAAGKTVMTTEPKFIPDEGAELDLEGARGVRVKLIDCVGYVVPDALGQTEDGAPRMVRTPWSEEPMPFVDAAELGTRKVITDHSTVALLVTTDGSICDLPRAQYTDAEERVAAELKKMGKPYAVVLNSADPNSESAVALAYELEEKYGAPVALVNCLQLEKEDIARILELILREFPLRELRVTMPRWTGALEDGHPILQSLTESILSTGERLSRMGDASLAAEQLRENEYATGARVEKCDLGSGSLCLSVDLRPELYYDVISEMSGLDVRSDGQLISLLRSLAETKKKYDKVEAALKAVEKEGYGIVMPETAELRLEEPKIVKAPGGYGVRLRASAPSIHMIRAEIETEISPIVGTEAQSEELVKFLLDGFKEDPAGLWETNMFGRSLHEMVTDGLQSKLENMPDDARAKLSETLSRIINEGSGGLICILL